MTFKINDLEWKFILYLVVFDILFFTLFYYNEKSHFLDNLSSGLSFLFISVGVYVMIYIVLRAFAIGKKFKLTVGLLGIFLLNMAYDLLQPEYHISVSGELTKGATLGAASSDYFLGTVGQALGIHGVFLFIFVYGFMFTILIVGAAYLLKNFWEA